MSLVPACSERRARRQFVVSRGSAKRALSSTGGYCNAQEEREETIGMASKFSTNPAPEVRSSSLATDEDCTLNNAPRRRCAVWPSKIPPAFDWATLVQIT